MKYYGKDNPLVETCDFVVEALTFEGKDGKVLSEGVRPTPDDHMVLEGVIQRYDVQNLNKRTYPKKVWEKQLAEDGSVMKKISAGGMIGHLEHPKDGTTDLNMASHLVREARILPNGEVRGRVVVLKNVNGEKIESIIRAGGRVGISSRGTGSVDDKGVVQEDYQVETWDIVHNPSTPGAHIAPSQADESLDEGRGEGHKIGDEMHGYVHLDKEHSAKHKEVPVHHVATNWYNGRAAHKTQVHAAVKLLRGAGHHSLADRVEKHAAQHHDVAVHESAEQTVNAVQETKVMTEDKSTQVVAEDENHDFSVEQDVFGQKGVDFVKSKTGIADPVSLSNIHYRFFKWARQRGAVDKSMEAAWDSFSKINPLVTGEAPTAAVPAGAEPSKPAEQKPMDGENRTVPHHENAETKKVEAKVTETAESLLEAARGEITKLAAEIASLTESKNKATLELETSKAAITETQATVSRLQAKVEEQAKSLDKASKTIAALTAFDEAAQVREAIEDAIRQDERLATFRDSLELQKTPAAVEAKAQAILGTLAESAHKTTTTAPKPTVAERIRDRARREVAESTELPTKPVRSDDDANRKVDESSANRPAHAGAKAAAAAIRKIHD